MRFCDEYDGQSASSAGTERQWKGFPRIKQSAVEVAPARSLFVFGVGGRTQIRCEPLRFSEMGAGFRARASLLQRECQLIVCLRIVRRKSDGLAEFCDGAGEVACLELLKTDADSKRRSLLVRLLLD